MVRTYTRRTLLIGVSTVSLAGCVGLFGDGPAITDAHLGEPVDAVTVDMTSRGGERFDPTLVHVNTGGTVTWELQSGVHDSVAYHAANDLPTRIPEGGTPWNSGLMSTTGETYEVTFETEGIYDYVCTPHAHVGMVGRVVVGMPSLDDQPALDGDASPLPRDAQRTLDELDQRVEDALG